jgi:predicted nucleic acid-binding protein
MRISGSAGFLLDTNVISEATRPKPDAKVIAWLDTADEDLLFISVATIAEINFGIAGMPAGSKQRRLREWLNDELIPRFDRRFARRTCRLHCYGAAPSAARNRPATRSRPWMR